MVVLQASGGDDSIGESLTRGFVRLQPRLSCQCDQALHFALGTLLLAQELRVPRITGLIRPDCY